MNWFQHDTDATQDAKIKKLIIRHGAVGYAVYFHCLELIAADISESNLTFELEHDSEIIADNLHIKGTSDKSGREVVETIMVDIIALGLFTETEGRIFCIKLLKRVSLSMTSSPSFRLAIAKKKEQYHDTVMIRHDPSCQSHETLPVLHDITNTTKKKREVFKQPTIDEVKEYCQDRENVIDAERFIDYYSSKGWMIGKNKMKDWRAAVRTWEKNESDKRGLAKPRETVPDAIDADEDFSR